MTESRSPLLVDWAVTAQCNLKCKHCRGMPGEKVSARRARELVAEISGLRPGWVIVEGGEPLLREDIFELLELMRRSRLEVHLITNGMLVSPQILADLKRLGVKVMVSIDGATPATYESIRNGAVFDRVVQAARSYAQEGLLESINLTLLKANYTEIPGVFELAASIGVGKVTVIGLKPCEGYAAELLTPAQYREAITLACQAARKTGVEFFFDEPFFTAATRQWGLMPQTPEVNTGILDASTTACIFGEYIFIDTDGGVKPCSFAPIALGNVNEKPLGQVWEEMLASPFLRQVKAPESRRGYCRSCQYLAGCKGCRSRTFVLTGDWFAADPVCPLGSIQSSKEEAK